jgi:ATP-dependent exoDNAse (exonuclease V) beta subunit
VRILASAGSGKTYQLATRYLALAFAGAPVDTILASTFTRAAAGEIRDRILRRLAEAAEDDAKLAQLAAAVDRPDLSRDAVIAGLRSMTSNLHRLQIRTLDSFFAALVHSFALELGVPLGASIIDEDETGLLRWDALRAMMETGEASRLIDLLRRLTQGAPSRAVVSVLERTIDELLEISREALPGAWEAVPARPALTDDELRVAVNRLVALAPGGGFARPHGDDCDQARAGDWETFLSKGLAKAIATGKTTFNKATIDEATREVYEPLIDHARAALWNVIRDQTAATGRLLDQFEAQLADVQRRRRVLTFSDLTAALARAQGTLAFEDVCFRLDARLHHVLLDEFQDTSVAQWRALAPIAHELVSDATGERPFLCVGDVKQSIYGWRNACPEVFDEIPRLLQGPDGTSAIADETLALSRRSSPVIIDIVNELFHDLPGNEALRDDGPAAQHFQEGFEEHDTVHDKLPGYFELRTVRRAGKNESADTLRLRTAAERIAELHREAPNVSIGVLTRTNDAVSRLLYELKRLDVEASGRGGGPLTDSTPVNAVVDLITMVDHPDDTIAAFHVAGGPIGALVGLADVDDRNARLRAASKVRRQLCERGFASCISEWARALAPECAAREHRRLLELIELGEEFDERDEARPGAFAAFVEARRVADVEPARVSVMTIHQAKGIEFDAVVLPELEVDIADEGSVVYERDASAGAIGPIEKLCRWVRRDQRNAMPGLDAMHDAYRMRVVRESLCLLYVGVTRAKQALIVLLDPPGLLKGGRVTDNVPKKLSGVIRCAFVGTAPPEPDTLLVERGDAGWHAAAEVEELPGGPRSVPTGVSLAEGEPGRGRAVRARAASELSHRRAGVLRPVLELGDGEALDLGRAVHALFERLTWIEDFTADEAELEAIVARSAPRRDAAWRRGVVAAFLESLQRPEVRDRLARGDRPADGVKVWTEQPFARLQDGAVQQGSIDRLVAEYDAAGRPQRAVVIDFKTDRIEAKEAADKAEDYRPQLGVYRAAAATMLGLAEDAVEQVLLFVHPGVAVDLSEPATLFG